MNNEKTSERERDETKMATFYHLRLFLFFFFFFHFTDKRFGGKLEKGVIKTRLDKL